jgi:flavin-dependent dehydrogenase
MQSRYDVIVVGARPAGAGTALLLARQGARVLMIDRGRYGADTLSTHALMRGGVLQLARWGVLPDIVAAGTPPVTKARFIYGDEPLEVAVKPKDGVNALYAPRRTILDRVLVDAAIAAGVEVAYGTTLVDLLRQADGRVCGVVTAGEAGAVHAGLVIGADGIHSPVARLTGAAITSRGQWAAANVFGYWPDLEVDGYDWYYRPGSSAGAIPTNGGLTCVFASAPAARFGELFKRDVAGGYHAVLREVAPALENALRQRSPEGSLRGFAGVVGYLRRSAGPGWALVGDAGYFKDPLTAHGITDALIDAEYLARAIQAGTDTALADYETARNERARVLFEVTDRLASFTWTLDEARVLHKQLAEAMGAEVKALLAASMEEATA